MLDYKLDRKQTEDKQGPEQKEELTFEECFSRLECLLKNSNGSDYTYQLENENSPFNSLKKLFKEKRISMPLEEYDKLKEEARINKEKYDSLFENYKRITNSLYEAVLKFGRLDPNVRYSTAIYVGECLAKGENIAQVEVRTIQETAFEDMLKVVYVIDILKPRS